MGRKEIAALIDILTRENERGGESVALGAWTIGYDKARGAFVFDRCEAGGYCEERPGVVALDGSVLDAGGPLLGGGGASQGSAPAGASSATRT